RDLVTELQRLLNQQSTFPFIKNLSPLLDKVQSLMVMDYSQLLTSVKDYEDDLLDAKEDVLDKIRNFLNSEQANIYRQIAVFLSEHNSNLRYVEHEEEIGLLRNVQNHEAPYSGTLIRDAKLAMDQLSGRIKVKQDEARNKVNDDLTHYISLLKKDSHFQKLSEQQQHLVLHPLKIRLKEIAN